MQKLTSVIIVWSVFCAGQGWSKSYFGQTADVTLTGISCPYFLTLGDLNGDGKLDLAVSSWVAEKGGKGYDSSKGSVCVFYQKSGRFSQPPDRVFKIPSPWALRIADVDGDAREDLVVAETRRYLHLFLAAEDFALDHKHANTNHGGRSLAVARLSKAGQMDLLCGATWRCWLGGDQFRDGYVYGPKVNDNTAVRLHDVNRDGHQDAAFLASGSVRVYCGPFPELVVKPSEVSNLFEVTPPDPARSYAIADLNADGRPDIAVGVVPEKGTGRASRTLIYCQQAPMGFPAGIAPSYTIANAAGSISTADVNRDGRNDLIICNSRARKVWIVCQQEQGGFVSDAEAADQTLDVRNYNLAVADVNGDNWPDIAVSDGYSVVRVFLNRGEEEDAEPSALCGRMPYYTGSVLPTPQRAAYRDVFVPLDGASLLLGDGLTPDGPHLKLLQARVEAVGGSLSIVDGIGSSGSVCIALGPCRDLSDALADRPVPEREQGYRMDTVRTDGKAIVALRGHDRLGLLWALSSFVQLLRVHDGKAVVREADIVDYPSTANRGFIAGNWPDGAYYSIVFKFNKPVFQSALVPRDVPRSERAHAWRKPPTAQVVQDIRTMGELLTPFGIQWYAGFNPIHGTPEQKVRSDDEEDFQAALRLSRLVAAAGGHLCLKYDDNRFPIHPDDIKRFGTGREADIYFINRLFSAVRKEFPRFRILFCPPFYWGPSAPTMYPEPRDDYLFALGRRLPKEVEIFWTGPRVKSGVVKPEYVEWISARLQRKPVYWQNSFGMPHSYGYHYATDPVPTWQEWTYDGFLERVDTYMLNSMMPNYCAANGTVADFCWNPEQYDPQRSIEQACSKLVGDDAYRMLIRLNEAMCWFDKFGLRQTPAAARLLPEMAARLEAVNTIWNDVKTTNLWAVERWTGMAGHVHQLNRFYQRLKRNPRLTAFSAPSALSLQRATDEVGIGEGTDTFLSAIEFVGGAGPAEYGNRCEKRLATWVYGSRSANPRMEASFEVDPFPPAGDYLLIVSAQDDDADAKCDIRIKVNDTVIFEAENPFVRLGWSRHTFRIPGDALRRQNKLLIENTEPTGRLGGPPFFMLNYAVLRKTVK